MRVPDLSFLRLPTAALLAASVLCPADAAARASADTSEGWPYVAPPPPPPPPPTAAQIAEAERRAAKNAERRRIEEEERRRNPPPPAPVLTPEQIAEKEEAARVAEEARRAAARVDIELLLLVDSSKSVDAYEWALQVDGYVQAFQDEAVQAQILRSNGVAVMFMPWSSTHQRSHFGWHKLETAEDCEAFALKIRDFPRSHADNTIMSNAIGVGVHLMRTNQFEGRRHVVDVSGDGVCENQSYYAEHERGLNPALDALMGNTWDTILASVATRSPQVVVNGISIGDVPGLEQWYAETLPQGDGSFAMHAEDFDEFAVGIREKLIRELEPNSYD